MSLSVGDTMPEDIDTSDARDPGPSLLMLCRGIGGIAAVLVEAYGTLLCSRASLPAEVVLDRCFLLRPNKVAIVDAQGHEDRSARLSCYVDVMSSCAMSAELSLSSPAAVYRLASCFCQPRSRLLLLPF